MNFLDSLRAVSALEAHLVWETSELLRHWVVEFFRFHLWSFFKTEKDIISSLGAIITAVTAVWGVYVGLKNL